MSADTIPDNNTPDIEVLADMLTRGDFPENYDNIIRNMSDDDIERLWAVFKQKRSGSLAGIRAAGGSID